MSKSEDVDESVDLAAVRTGDTSAFATLYLRHRSSALAFAGTLVGSDDAGDVVAESFTKILKALRTGTGPQDRLRPYLFTTIRSVAIDRSRRSLPSSFESDENDEHALDGVGARALADDLADRDLVRRIMERLPDRWRHTLWLSEVEGKPPRLLAAELGVSPNTAAAVLHRAREGLRTAYLAEWLLQQPASDHHKILESLPSFVRDSLRPRARRMVADHLATCAACTAVTAQLRLVNVSLSGQAFVVLAVALVPAAVVAGKLGFGVAAASGPLFGLATKAAAGATLAAAVGATVVVIGFQRTPAPDNVQPVAETTVSVGSSTAVTSRTDPVPRTSTSELPSTPTPTATPPPAVSVEIQPPAATSSPTPDATPSPTPVATQDVSPPTTPVPPAPDPPQPSSVPASEPAPSAVPDPPCQITLEGPQGVECVTAGPPSDPAVQRGSVPPADPAGSVPLFDVTGTPSG